MLLVNGQEIEEEYFFALLGGDCNKEENVIMIVFCSVHRNVCKEQSDITVSGL